jgi:predicted lipoprotein with Yx(FWY)xxD motif
VEYPLRIPVESEKEDPMLIAGRPLVMHYRAMLLVCALAGAASAVAAADPASMREGGLVAPNGMTLYICDGDADGVSACVGSCTEKWPPYAVPPDATASGAFSIIERADGARQYAYRGRPLYFRSGDAAPGESEREECHAVK